jgi:hypothetical protein
MGWLQPHMPQERKHWMDLSDQHPCPSWTDIQAEQPSCSTRTLPRLLPTVDLESVTCRATGSATLL